MIDSPVRSQHMIRTLAVVTLIAALAAPAFAGDPPMVINMPSASKAPAASTPVQPQQAKPADQLPKVVNYPSGSDGTMPAPKPAGDAAKPTTAPMAVMAFPSVYPLGNFSAMNPYAGLSGDYTMSMFGGPAYYEGGFPGASFAAAMAGASYFGSLPPGSGYFYTFAPPAVMYRDITSTPLGVTARFAPDGTVIENPVGYVGLAGAAMIVR